MTDEPHNIILEHLRDIRQRLSVIEGKIDSLSTQTEGHTGILIGLGHYIHSLDHRVEQLEVKIGA